MLAVGYEKIGSQRSVKAKYGIWAVKVAGTFISAASNAQMER
jgi:hypothetical protein